MAPCEPQCGFSGHRRASGAILSRGIEPGFSADRINASDSMTEMIGVIYQKLTAKDKTWAS